MPKTRIEWSDSVSVAVKIGDCTYDGSYRTGGDRISVSYGFLSKDANLQGAPPKALAAMLLTELVGEEARMRRP